jgi:hypothetical protein
MPLDERECSAPSLQVLAEVTWFHVFAVKVDSNAARVSAFLSVVEWELINISSTSFELLFLRSRKAPTEKPYQNPKIPETW